MKLTRRALCDGVHRGDLIDWVRDQRKVHKSRRRQSQEKLNPCCALNSFEERVGTTLVIAAVDRRPCTEIAKADADDSVEGSVH